MIIKQIEEDFYVEEDFKPVLEGGEYAYFILKKKGWSTIKAVHEIARELRISYKRFGYCGNKDKQAVTVQYASVYNVNKEDLESLSIKDIEIRFVGYGKDRLNLGSHNGNFFIIVVRDLDKEKKVKTKKILNLFDEQRFGKDELNWKIGEALVKHNFKEACELLDLEIKEKDYVSRLMKFDKKRLRFYISAYQSRLWNKVVNKLKMEYEKVPLLGFLTEINEEEIKNVYDAIMEKEGITKENFMIKAMREISVPGGEREMFIEPRDFKIEYQDDDLNEGKKKAIVRFWLNKGAYATLVVKELFK